MRRLFVLVTALFLLCTQTLAAPEQTSAGVHLEKLDIQCLVDETGQAAITATATVQVEQSLDTLLLPLDQQASDYEVAGCRAKRVKEGEFVYLQVKDEAGFTGSRTFTVHYRIPGALGQEDEAQRYDLSLISPWWLWGAQSCSFQVTMPKSFTATPGFFSGYYGDVVEGNLDIRCDGKTVSGAYTQPLMDHEALSMRLTLPPDYFAPTHTSRSGLVLDGLLAVLIAACAVYWWRKLRDQRLSVQARTLPPDGGLAGELPYFFTCDRPDFGLMCMHWACLGYLSVYLNHRYQVVLRENMPMGNERRPVDVKLFSSLFRADPVCNASGLRFGKLCRRAETALMKFWRRRLFDPAGGSAFLLLLLSSLGGALTGVQIALGLAPAGLWRWAAAAALAAGGLVAGYQIPQLAKDVCLRRYRPAALRAGAFAVLVALAALAGKSRSAFLAMVLFALAAFGSLYGGRRSQMGREALAQVRGFRRFLTHASENHLHLMLHRDSQYFYKLLPYAQALGMGRSFAKKFGEIELEPCDYFTSHHPIGPTAMDFYEEFLDALHQMEQARNKAG